MTPSANKCHECNWSASCLIKTMDKGYKYIIKEEGEKINEIFMPIEMLNI
jgi:hypothetical protein